MPYKIDKKKCKQSDGDAGNHVLSYTDGKGKEHNNCHTSKKGAQGQIAAIEGDNLAETDDMVFGGGGDTEAEEEESGEPMDEVILREFIREKLISEMSLVTENSIQAVIGKFLKSYKTRDAGTAISREPNAETGMHGDLANTDYILYPVAGSYDTLRPATAEENEALRKKASKKNKDRTFSNTVFYVKTGQQGALAGFPDGEVIDDVAVNQGGGDFITSLAFVKSLSRGDELRPVGKAAPKTVIKVGDAYYTLPTSALRFVRKGDAKTPQQKGIDYEVRTGAIAQGIRFSKQATDDLLQSGDDSGEGVETSPEQERESIQTLAVIEREAEEGGVPPGLSINSPFLEGIEEESEKKKYVAAARIGAQCAGIEILPAAQEFKGAGNTDASDLDLVQNADIGGVDVQLKMELKLSAGATLTAFTPVMTVAGDAVTWATAGSAGGGSTGDQIYGVEYLASWNTQLGTAETLGGFFDQALTEEYDVRAHPDLPKALTDALAGQEYPGSLTLEQKFRLYLEHIVTEEKIGAGDGKVNAVVTPSAGSITFTGCDYKIFPGLSTAALGPDAGPSAVNRVLADNAEPYEKYYGSKKDSYILIGKVKNNAPGLYKLGNGSPLYDAALDMAGVGARPPSFRDTGRCEFRFFYRPVGKTLYAQGQLNALDSLDAGQGDFCLPGYTDLTQYGSFTGGIPDGPKQRMKNLIALSVITCNQRDQWNDATTGLDMNLIFDMILNSRNPAVVSAVQEKETASEEGTSPEGSSSSRLGKNPIMTEQNIRLMIRQRLIEDLTRADRKEIERIFNKQMEKSKVTKKIVKKEIDAQNKMIQTMVDKAFKKNFDKELKSALGVSFFGTPGKINKFVIDEIQSEVEKILGDKATKEIVVQICKDVIIKLYRELSFSYQPVIQRLKV